ncbi:sulfur carrier protein ThiS [Pukyongiella litopenaei]|uniref:Sulfur carrier protein ThiS n=1 Tax=Pukyongiella litopenaei TaxID=2605946 RepID=A0A2S0MSC3_9RHOB|nr:sulfur carrier protein ThiS [Pukyongiella litopenaei]AVO38717.1 sulfur carrier protein ThiS [Pukyongiella litopenaei]
MRVDVNGRTESVRGGTLADLIDELGFDADSVATALDGVFVPRADRAAIPMRDGAKVEVLSPMQGG